MRLFTSLGCGMMGVMTIGKYAALLTVLLPLAGTASAEGIAGHVDAYRNLPGVKPPSNGAMPNQDYACTTAIEPRRYDRDDMFRRGGNGIVYSCMRNGVTVQGSGPPGRQGWLPGERQTGWPWGK